MPIDTHGSIIPSTITGFVGTSLKSPFWLALMITASLILIIIFVYPAKKSSSVAKLFKLMIYVFGTVLVFVMLHDNIVQETWRIEHEDKTARDMIGNMSDFINNGSKPAIPATFGQPVNILPAQPRVQPTGLIN